MRASCSARFAGWALALTLFGASTAHAGPVVSAPFYLPAYSDNPSVATDGSGYLMAWQLETGAAWVIQAARVNYAGQVMDDGGFVVGSSSTSAFALAPVVASNGQDYVVVWNTNTEIRATRVSAGGLVLDPAGLLVGSHSYYGQIPTAVASNGADYLVGWADQQPNQMPAQILAARVNADGGLPDSPPLMVGTLSPSVAGVEYLEPGVASNGQTYLVVWPDGISGSVFAQTVWFDGGLGPLAVLPDAGAGGDPGPDVAVASDGQDFLLAWIQYPYYRLVGARVSAAGALMDAAPLPLASNAVTDYAPGLSGSPGSYLLAWEDTTTFRELRTARVSPSGQMLDAPAWPLGMEGPTAYDPSVSLVSATGGVAVYGRNGQFPPTGRPAAFQLLDFRGNGAPCSDVSGCTSGFCVDGACCDSTCGGGSVSDCMACSVDAGGPVDGVCSPIQADAGFVCLQPSACENSASCDGVSTSCPSRIPVTNGTLCDGGFCSQGACVPEEGDGGVADGGRVDAGMQRDGGLRGDAGSVADSGPAADGGSPSGPASPHGCGCSTASLGELWGALVFVAGALASRRRSAKGRAA